MEWDKWEMLIAIAAVIACIYRHLVLGVVVIFVAHFVNTCESLLGLPPPKPAAPGYIVDRLYVRRARRVSDNPQCYAPWHCKDPFLVLGATNDERVAQ